MKPNLFQKHSSYVITDPKGDIAFSYTHALIRSGYQVRLFNVQNFHKSMHYNPFACNKNAESAKTVRKAIDGEENIWQD